MNSVDPVFIVLVSTIAVLSIPLVVVLVKSTKASTKQIYQVWVVKTSGHSDIKTSAGSAVSQGLVGGALLGGVGVIAGAATARKKVNKKKAKTTFLVQYVDSSQSKVTCKDGSRLYCKLIKYVR